MGKSLKARFEEEGVDKAEITHDINLKGLLPVSQQRGCSFEALKHYAEEVLEMHNPPLLNTNFTKANQELFRDFILAMYDIWKQNQETIDSLKAEMYKRKHEDELRNALAKGRLLEMLDSAKSGMIPA